MFILKVENTEKAGHKPCENVHLDLCCAESACHRSNKTIQRKGSVYHVPVLVNTIRPSGLVGVFIQRTGVVFYRTR